LRYEYIRFSSLESRKKSSSSWFFMYWSGGIDSKEPIPLANVARAGILKQSMGARNRVGIGLSYRPARLQKAGGIDSLESILLLHKRLKIPAQSLYW
jgi:hypothetical protein